MMTCILPKPVFHCKYLIWLLSSIGQLVIGFILEIVLSTVIYWPGFLLPLSLLPWRLHWRDCSFWSLACLVSFYSFSWDDLSKVPSLYGQPYANDTQGHISRPDHSWAPDSCGPWLLKYFHSLFSGYMKAHRAKTEQILLIFPPSSPVSTHPLKTFHIPGIGTIIYPVSQTKNMSHSSSYLTTLPSV